jgi:hypothetical protein
MASKDEARISYTTLLSHLDAQVESILPNQVVGKARSDRGGFVSAAEGMAGSAQFGCAQALGFAWLCEGSRYFGDSEILDRLALASNFAKEIRRPSGRFDLISTNWDCGPYTAFVVQALAPMVAAARRSSLPEAEQIEQQWSDIIRMAVPGMVAGGFHTPNHRWVLTSALSQALTLYPDLDALSTIEAYLAETVDINPDGEYTERSTAVYNAICNRSLRLTAESLNCPELLDPVRQNLDASYRLLHADGSVITSLSNRQDRGKRVVPVFMIDSYYALARIDENGFYASTADWLSSFDRAAVPWSIEPFLSHPEWRDDDLERSPLPTHYSHLMPESGVWRARRGKRSATAAIGITSPFCIRQGNIDVNVKICATYFGLGQFKGDRLTPTDSGVRLEFDGKGRRHDGPIYSHPVGHAVSMEDYQDVMMEREVTVMDPLEMSLDVREVEGGFDLRLVTSEPFDNIPVEVLFAFSPGGTLHSECMIIDGTAGHTAFLRRGSAIYHKGADAISIGPGTITHRMRDMRNSEPEPTAFRLLTTLITPVDHTIQIRTGVWSEATEAILKQDPENTVEESNQ